MGSRVCANAVASAVRISCGLHTCFPLDHCLAKQALGRDLLVRAVMEVLLVRIGVVEFGPRHLAFV